MVKLLVSGLLFTTLAFASAVSYDGFQAVRVPTENNSARVADIVQRLELDTWTHTTSFADIIIPPEKLSVFKEEVAGLDVEIMHEDLGASIALEKQLNFGAVHEPAGTVDAGDLVNDLWFDEYHEYTQHLSWMAGLHEAFPDNSQIISVGKSVEGNDILCIHIFGSSGGGSQPAVVFHGTVHAREWITTKVVEYTAFALLSKYSGDDQIREMVDKYDFYLFPVANPDGFKYTSTDRLWRKNRQAASGSTCLGRDINRNWPYMWDSEGSSTHPCSQTFRGEDEADAPETQALISSLTVIENRQGLKLYIDWHSYSQLMMWGYGYTKDDAPKNDYKLQTLAERTAQEMTKSFGTQFAVGPIASTIYKAAGCSVDYVQDVLGGEYVYTIELRDKGKNGFLIPKGEILPSSVESFEGIKCLLTHME